MTTKEFKAARKALNLTQQALGDKVGLTGRRIRQIEAGGKIGVSSATILRGLLIEIEARYVRERIFNYFYKNHEILLLESEIDDILSDDVIYRLTAAGKAILSGPDQPPHDGREH